MLVSVIDGATFAYKKRTTGGTEHDLRAVVRQDMDNDRLRNTSDHPRLLPGHITAAFNSKAFEDIFAGKMYKGGNLHNIGYEDEHVPDT